MNKYQEKVLVATLCGLVITAAGAYVVQPALANGSAHRVAATSDVGIDRCLAGPDGAQWCLAPVRAR